MLNITKHVNDLVLKMQVKDQIIQTCMINLKDSNVSYLYWKSSLKNKDLTYFSTCKINKSSLGEVALEWKQDLLISRLWKTIFYCFLQLFNKYQVNTQS